MLSLQDPSVACLKVPASLQSGNPGLQLDLLRLLVHLIAIFIAVRLSALTIVHIFGYTLCFLGGMKIALLKSIDLFTSL